MHGYLLNAIQDALHKLGKTVDDITIEDLAPVDEFHIGGRVATENFLAQLPFTAQHHLIKSYCAKHY